METGMAPVRGWTDVRYSMPPAIQRDREGLKNGESRGRAHSGCRRIAWDPCEPLGAGGFRRRASVPPAPA